MTEFVIKPRIGHEPESQEEQSFLHRLKSSMVRLGDQSPLPLEESFDQLTRMVLEEGSNNTEQIVSFMLECVEKLPLKTPVYGTFAGVLNVKSFEFVSALVKHFNERFQAALDEKSVVCIKLHMRFAAELVNANVITHSSFMELMRSFIENVVENSQENNGESQSTHETINLMGDFLVRILLLTLPYVGQELNERSRESANYIMELVDKYASKRTPKPSELYSQFDSFDETSDSLSILLSAVKLCQGSDWEVSIIPKVYKRFETKLNGSMQHDLPAFKLPTESSGLKPSSQQFKLFDSHSDSSPCRAIDRVLLGDLLVDTIFFFNESRKDCVKQISSIEATFATEEILTEVLFSQLLTLPSPDFKTLYYHTLLTDLSRQNPAMSGVIHRGVNLLFEKMGYMDVECVIRLGDFLGTYLNAIDHKWDWTQYIPFASQPNTMQYHFLRQALGTCVSLSYIDRIKTALPADLHPLLPPTSSGRFKYEKGDDKPCLISRELVTRIRRKEVVEDTISWLKEELDFPDTTQRIEVLLQTFYFLGQRSFGHLSYVLDKYGGLLSELCSDTQSRRLILKGIKDFWGDDLSHQITYVDRLIQYNIVDGKDVIEWLLSAENLTSLLKEANLTIAPHRYESLRILSIAIEKSYGKIKSMERELKRMNEADEKTEQDLTDIAEAETKLASTKSQAAEALLALFTNYVILLSNEGATSKPESGSITQRLLSGQLVLFFRKYKDEFQKMVPELEKNLKETALPPPVAALLLKIKS